MSFSLFVPGRPAAQGSKRHVGRGILVEQSQAVAPWRTLVAWHASQVWRQAPLDGPLQVRLTFVMPRPSGTAKRSTPPAVKRPDLDKLQRAIFDALSGVCWRDDSQVVDVHASKRIAELDERPGAHIEISPQIDARELDVPGQPRSREREENPPTSRLAVSNDDRGAA